MLVSPERFVDKFAVLFVVHQEIEVYTDIFAAA
jgi:hypothetical protein